MDEKYSLVYSDMVLNVTNWDKIGTKRFGYLLVILRRTFTYNNLIQSSSEHCLLGSIGWTKWPTRIFSDFRQAIYADKIGWFHFGKRGQPALFD